MSELQDLLGDEWIKTFDDMVQAGDLLDALSWAMNTSRSSNRIDAVLSWKSKAQKTADAYREIRVNSQVQSQWSVRPRNQSPKGGIPHEAR